MILLCDCKMKAPFINEIWQHKGRVEKMSDPEGTGLQLHLGMIFSHMMNAYDLKAFDLGDELPRITSLQYCIAICTSYRQADGIIKCSRLSCGS